MRYIHMILISFSFIFLGISIGSAEIYEFVNDQGIKHYTNIPSSIPETSYADLSVYDEIPLEFLALKGPNIYRMNLSDDDSLTSADGELEIQAQIIEVDELQCKEYKGEYQQLYDEKQAMDNDKSYNKRKIKRKYKHRPYIKALNERYQKIGERMTELEALMEPCGISKADFTPPKEPPQQSGF